MARLIDADDLKKAVLDLDLDNSPYWLVVKAIDNAPTVTPDMAQVLAYESGKASAERPTGEWIEGTQGFYCSKCDYYDRDYFEHNFCPNCGVTIKGVERWD